MLFHGAPAAELEDGLTTGPGVSLAPHDCVGHDGAIDPVHHTDLVR